MRIRAYPRGAARRHGHVRRARVRHGQFPIRALTVDPGDAGITRLAAIVDAHPVTVGRTMIGDEE